MASDAMEQLRIAAVTILRAVAVRKFRLIRPHHEQAVTASGGDLDSALHVLLHAVGARMIPVMLIRIPAGDPEVVSFMRAKKKVLQRPRIDSARVFSLTTGAHTESPPMKMWMCRAVIFSQKWIRRGRK